MPAMSGWSSGMLPQPMSGDHGQSCSSSAGLDEQRGRMALITPPPETISGRSASLSMLIAFLAHYGRGLVPAGARRRSLDVELDLGQLHVDRQVDQHGAGRPGAHQVEGLLEGARGTWAGSSTVVAHW